MNPFRKILRLILGFLSSYAIKKHKIEVIVVAGWYGSDIARELSYTILNDNLRVRRNTQEIWWDFSIPLAILGYKDKRRSTYMWLLLIFRAFVYLIISKPNPHILLLNANCTFEHTAKYWASIVKPDTLVILNNKKDSVIVKELLRSMIKNKKGKLVYNLSAIDSVTLQELRHNLDLHTFSLEAGSSKDIIVTSNKQYHIILYGKKKYTIPKSELHGITPEVLAASLALAKSYGVDLAEASFSLLKFELPASIIAKIRTNLEVNKVQ